MVWSDGRCQISAADVTLVVVTITEASAGNETDPDASHDSTATLKGTLLV